MSDDITKIQMLWTVFIRCAFDEWKQEVWSKDLDAQYCCDGHMCGCEGATVRDVFMSRSKP